MKRLNSKLSSDHSPIEIPKSLSRRRLVGQVVLGGAAALMLTACGGGSDSSSDSSRDLLAAYYRLKDGMTWDEAVAAVGWEPNNGSTSWHENGYLLSCSRHTKVGTNVMYLSWANISKAGEIDVGRSFSF